MVFVDKVLFRFHFALVIKLQSPIAAFHNEGRFCNNGEIDTLISKPIIYREQSETLSTGNSSFTLFSTGNRFELRV